MELFSLDSKFQLPIYIAKSYITAKISYETFKKFGTILRYILHRYYIENVVHIGDTCNPAWVVEIWLLIVIYTVGFQKSLRIASVRSKTTLISGCVCGKWVDPPFCKINTFFLMSLALCVPICRNFQSNGAKWRSLKLWLLQQK